VTAREALAKARHTLDCLDDPIIPCAVSESYYANGNRHVIDEGFEGTHRAIASCLLDGFSVRAVTEAGG